MKKTNLFLTAILFVSTAASAAEKIYTCGDLNISDVCNKEECSISLMTEKYDTKLPQEIKIIKLDDVVIKTVKDIVDLEGLVGRETDLVCVSGAITGSTIQNAQREYLN